MHGGGHLGIKLSESHSTEGSPDRLFLTIEDDGPGIQTDKLETVFEPGFTTHNPESAISREEHGGWPAIHRGLGLSICRSIVEAAGGEIRVANQPTTGARFEIQLPVLLR
jgi:signal transduction histidine kinase